MSDPARQRLDIDWVTREVERLGRRHRIAFATFWAQHLYPMYGRFCLAGGSGNPARLQRCLDLAWGSAAGHEAATTDLDACQHELAHLAPEIDSEVLAYAAMEGAAAAWDCLETVRGGSVSHAVRPLEAFGAVIVAYLTRRDATLGSMDVEGDQLSRPDAGELWRPHMNTLEWVLAELARSRRLHESTLASMRERAADARVESLTNLLAVSGAYAP